MICLALTGSTASASARNTPLHSSSLAVNVGCEMVEVAAAAGVLNDEAFFEHFFGRLRGGRGGDSGENRISMDDHTGGGGGDCGDGPDARILEQVGMLVGGGCLRRALLLGGPWFWIFCSVSVLLVLAGFILFYWFSCIFAGLSVSLFFFVLLFVFLVQGQQRAWSVLMFIQSISVVSFLVYMDMRENV